MRSKVNWDEQDQKEVNRSTQRDELDEAERKNNYKHVSSSWQQRIAHQGENEVKSNQTTPTRRIGSLLSAKKSDDQWQEIDQILQEGVEAVQGEIIPPPPPRDSSKDYMIELSVKERENLDATAWKK